MAAHCVVMFTRCMELESVISSCFDSFTENSCLKRAETGSIFRQTNARVWEDILTRVEFGKLIPEDVIIWRPL